MFIDVTVFGKSAEIVNQYFSKGKKILIEGKLKLESWVDTNNNKRSKHTVKCEAFYFVESKGTSGNQAQQYAQPQQYHNGVQYEVQQSPQQHQGQPQGNQPSFTIEDDDIPF
jgi:single-strand DNA-binding protein